MEGKDITRYRIFCLESEVEKLPPEISVEEQYPAFVIVSASAETIETVRKQYSVEALPDPKPPPEVPGLAGLAGVIAEPQRRGPYFQAVRFRAPVRPDWIKEIEATGCEFLDAIGSSTIVVKCPNKPSLAKLQTMPPVARITDYVPHIQISPEFFEGLGVEVDEAAVAEAAAKAASAETEPRPRGNLSAPGVLVATFFNEAYRRQAKRSLRRQSLGHISEAGQARLIINLTSSADPAQAVRAIADRPGLRSLEEKKIKRVYNNVARRIIADRVVSPDPPDGLGLTGEGEIVAVADSGLDTGDPLTIHPDFRGRVRNIQSFPITSYWSYYLNNPGDNDGPADIYSGHGTHVCGSVLGNGARSIEQGIDPIQGTAPGAELVFQAIEQTMNWNLQGIWFWFLLGGPAPAHGLFGIPEDLKDLLQAAYEQGARIHSNSWGGGAPGAYDEQCLDVDQFVWEHKDFLPLFAAGNEGEDTHPPGQGIDPMSVSSPGTAKNCLTVGASENNHPQFTDTYGEWWPDDFPREPFKSDRMVDSINDVVPFSSRGPCQTGRRSPDVVAPGTFVLSTRSSQIAANNFAWGSFPPAKNDYMYMGGTSMATPLVAGCVALVRQYLRQTVGIDNPSAALLKAAIIHSAQYHPYRYPHPASAPRADNEQGWGRVDLQRVLNPPSPARVLFLDEPQALQTGDFHQIDVEVADSSLPLRITMVYSDFPGQDLINNLNLLVKDPDGNFLVGNDFEGSGTPDADNNVEGIIVESPKPGTWSIRVVASNVPEGPQDFALVVSGERVRLV